MKTIKAVATLGALATMLGAASAHAGTGPDHCYDFSNMLDNQTFTVGDTIDTDFATINIKSYVVDGVPATAETRGAERASSQIAGGSSPELELKLVALNIVPKRPVTLITTRIAQSISQDGAFADSGIGVNRSGRKSATGFAGLDGTVIGDATTGSARIAADISPSGAGNWHSGTLEFRAVKGSIESIRLGGHTWRIDDMCFTY